MNDTLVFRVSGHCEICWGPATSDMFVEGHILCARCAMLGCGECWRAVMVRRERFWRWRWACPACGHKSKWRWVWAS